MRQSESEEGKCVSKVFGPIDRHPLPQRSREKLNKLLADFPQRRKQAQENCFSASDWQLTFSKLTGLSVTIAGTTSQETKPVSKGPKPSFIESILGKRKAS